jgi:hypothetical protein
MERPSFLYAEVISAKKPFLGGRSSLLAMTVDFDVERTMRDEIRKNKFFGSCPIGAP